MPNTHSTLTELFTDIADAIRAKTVGTADIVADEFPNAIDDIETGITPIGTINITDTALTNVSAYANAQVVDANLVAANIKKDVTILGVTGTHEGGSGMLHETGSIDIHTGSNKTDIDLPISDTTFTHYLVNMLATKSWVKEDGAWVARDSIDFTGLTAAEYPAIAVTNIYPWVKSNDYTIADGTFVEGAYIYNAQFVRVGIQTTAKAPEGYQYAGEIGDGVIKVHSSNRLMCATTWGLTFDYDIWGWN